MKTRATGAAYAALCACAFCLTGCSTGMLPNPEVIASTPLGTEAIKLGMSKARVESLWGKPDNVRFEEGKGAIRGQRELWFYGAHLSGIAPAVNAGYLSQSRTLCFDGDNLVEIK